MKKNATKLTLHRETLRHLVTPELRNVAGGAFAALREDDSQSIQSGETFCWCSKTCNCCATETQAV
jgi:hypothetical protein